MKSFRCSVARPHERARLARLVLLVGALCLSSVASTLAQPEPRGSTSSEQVTSRFEFRPTFRTVWYSNYFRVSDEAPQADVREDQLRLQLSYQLSEVRRIRVYGEVGGSQYDSPEIENARRSRVGVASGGRRHALDSSIGFVGSGRELDVSDTARSSDIWTWFGQYDYRVSDSWQLGMRAGLWNQGFDDDTPDVDTSELGARIRYRGFGPAFSPELGYSQRRSSGGVNGRNDFEEDLAYLRLRFRPVDAVRFSVRYRLRERAYTTPDQGVSNFQRDDERDRWTLAVQAELRRNVSLNLAYNHIDGSSTEASRVFASQDLGLSVTWRSGGS